MSSEVSNEDCFKISDIKVIIEGTNGIEYEYRPSDYFLKVHKDLDKLVRAGMINGYRRVADTDLSKVDILQIPKYWDKIDFTNRINWLESKGFKLCLDDIAKRDVNGILKFILGATLENSIEPSQVVDILDGMQEIGFVSEQPINDGEEYIMRVMELEPVEFRGEKFWGRKDIYDTLKMTEPVKKRHKDTFRKDLARAGRKDGFDRSGHKIE